jgi:hypothetical protein
MGSILVIAVEGVESTGNVDSQTTIRRQENNKPTIQPLLSGPQMISSSSTDRLE